MQHVFQSAFLQALGFAIANSLWQTALVWLIYMSVNTVVSFSASMKYRLAVSAQFTGFVWFMITFQFYYSQYTEALQHSSVSSTVVQNILSVNTDPSSRLIAVMLKTEQFLPYISMAYLILMLFLSVRWFLGYRQTQMIHKSGLQKIPAIWRVFVKRIADELGIQKDIRLFLSEAVTTPLTIGFFKPIILIPVASINHLTTDQLEAVLLHELAHIKRFDYLVNLILSVVELALFFNPFTQLLSKRIHQERENSCDDWVLQFKYNATVYAEALLRIAYLQTAPTFAMAASGKKNDLLIRIKRMIDQKEHRFSYRKQLLAFLIITGMLSSIAWLSPITSTHKAITGGTEKTLPSKKTETYAIEPMAVSVDNPLFNPMFFLSKPLRAEMKKNIATAQKEIASVQKEIQVPVNDIVSSIPPIVAKALEQASAALTDKKQAEFENGMAALALAKTGLEKAFHYDSVIHALPKKMQIPFSKDIARSIHQMNDEIKKEKLEIERQQKSKKAVLFDQEKVEIDIRKALEEVNRMDLGKLMVTALNIPGLILDDEGRQIRKMKMTSPTLPKVTNNLPKLKGSNPIEPEVPFPDQEKIERDIDVDLPAKTDPESTMIINQEKIRMDTEKLFRLKQLILLKEASRKQLRVVPVTYIIDGEKETKLLILLQ